jgi:hypothetical protein
MGNIQEMENRTAATSASGRRQDFPAENSVIATAPAADSFDGRASMTIQFEHNPLACALLKHHVFSGMFLDPLFDECFGCFGALYRINPNWFTRVWKCPKDIEVFHHEYASACMEARQLAPVHLNKIRRISG